ncbi:hypothetical protein HDU67_009519 [Dinochytrium kinnereticum]|nr:hypothetical protein HDU67_009519 [Dinochytrium kinnereticum]
MTADAEDGMHVDPVESDPSILAQEAPSSIVQNDGPSVETVPHLTSDEPPSTLTSTQQPSLTVPPSDPQLDSYSEERLPNHSSELIPTRPPSTLIQQGLMGWSAIERPKWVEAIRARKRKAGQPVSGEVVAATSPVPPGIKAPDESNPGSPVAGKRKRKRGGNGAEASPRLASRNALTPPQGKSKPTPEEEALVARKKAEALEERLKKKKLQMRDRRRRRPNPGEEEDEEAGGLTVSIGASVSSLEICRVGAWGSTEPQFIDSPYFCGVISVVLGEDCRDDCGPEEMDWGRESTRGPLNPMMMTASSHGEKRVNPLLGMHYSNEMPGWESFGVGGVKKTDATPDVPQWPAQGSRTPAKSRRGFSIRIQGRFKHEHSVDDVIFGTEFENPLTFVTPSILSASKGHPLPFTFIPPSIPCPNPVEPWDVQMLFMRFLRKLDPGISFDLTAQRPRVWTHLACAVSLLEAQVAPVVEGVVGDKEGEEDGGGKEGDDEVVKDEDVLKDAGDIVEPITITVEGDDVFAPLTYTLTPKRPNALRRRYDDNAISSAKSVTFSEVVGATEESPFTSRMIEPPSSPSPASKTARGERWVDLGEAVGDESFEGGVGSPLGMRAGGGRGLFDREGEVNFVPGEEEQGDVSFLSKVDERFSAESQQVISDGEAGNESFGSAAIVTDESFLSVGGLAIEDDQSSMSGVGVGVIDTDQNLLLKHGNDGHFLLDDTVQESIEPNVSTAKSYRECSSLDTGTFESAESDVGPDAKSQTPLSFYHTEPSLLSDASRSNLEPVGGAFNLQTLSASSGNNALALFSAAVSETEEISRAEEMGHGVVIDLEAGASGIVSSASSLFGSAAASSCPSPIGPLAEGRGIGNVVNEEKRTEGLSCADSFEVDLKLDAVEVGISVGLEERPLTEEKEAGPNEPIREDDAMEVIINEATIQDSDIPVAVTIEEDEETYPVQREIDITKDFETETVPEGSTDTPEKPRRGRAPRKSITGNPSTKKKRGKQALADPDAIETGEADSPAISKPVRRKRKRRGLRVGSGANVPDAGDLDDFEAVDPPHVSAGGREVSLPLAEARSVFQNVESGIAEDLSGEQEGSVTTLPDDDSKVTVLLPSKIPPTVKVKASYDPQAVLGVWAWGDNDDAKQQDMALDSNDRTAKTSEGIIPISKPHEDTTELFRSSLALYRRYGSLQFLGTLSEPTTSPSKSARKKPKSARAPSPDYSNLPTELHWLRDHVFRTCDEPTLDVLGRTLAPPSSIWGVKMRWRLRKRGALVELQGGGGVGGEGHYVERRRKLVGALDSVELEDLEEYRERGKAGVIEGGAEEPLADDLMDHGEVTEDSTVEAAEDIVELKIKNDDVIDDGGGNGLMDAHIHTPSLDEQPGGTLGVASTPKLKWAMPFAPTDSAEARREYFCVKAHREEVAFTPDCVYKMELSGDFMDLKTFELDLFDYRVKMREHLGDQPLQLICRSKARGIPFFVVEFSFVP